MKTTKLKVDTLVQCWLFAMIGLLAMAGTVRHDGGGLTYVFIGVLACFGCICSILNAIPAGKPARGPHGPYPIRIPNGPRPTRKAHKR